MSSLFSLYLNLFSLWVNEYSRDTSTKITLCVSFYKHKTNFYLYDVFCSCRFLSHTWPILGQVCETCLRSFIFDPIMCFHVYYTKNTFWINIFNSQLVFKSKWCFQSPTGVFNPTGDFNLQLAFFIQLAILISNWCFSSNWRFAQLAISNWRFPTGVHSNWRFLL